MSNESENENEKERIDLTQFEKMTKGSWEYTDMLKEKQTEWDLWSYDENGDPQIWLAQLGYYQDGAHSDTQDWERLHATWRAMSATPDLIAELKRCYKKIDKMDEAILSARELLMSYFDYEVGHESGDEAAQEILDVVKELRKASE